MYDSLDEFKRSRFDDIEAKTREILAAGKLVSGVRVSLELRKLVEYRTYTTLSAALGSITIEAANPLDAPLVIGLGLLGAGAFVDTVNDHVRTVYLAESYLKAAVRNATTPAEVEAVLDLRTPT